MIDHVEALALLGRAVNEMGEDYVYPVYDEGFCKYFREDGSPSCIVGFVLDYKGISIEHYATLNAEEVNELRAGGVIDLTDKAIAVLEAAQRTQDHSGTWGDALAEATRVAGRIEK